MIDHAPARIPPPSDGHEAVTRTCLEAARAQLSIMGFRCFDAGSSHLRFAGPRGSGVVDAVAPERVRVRWELEGGSGDAPTLARLRGDDAVTFKIVVRARRAAAEEVCALTDLTAVLERLARGACAAPRPLPIIDVAVGLFDAALPPLAGPAFLRLGRPAGAWADAARATYLLIANAHLAAVGGWLDGPGVAVDPARLDQARLRVEIVAVGQGLRVLADEPIARSYLELCRLEMDTQPRVPVETGRAAATNDKGGIT